MSNACSQPRSRPRCARPRPRFRWRSMAACSARSGVLRPPDGSSSTAQITPMIHFFPALRISPGIWPGSHPNSAPPPAPPSSQPTAAALEKLPPAWPAACAGTAAPTSPFAPPTAASPPPKPPRRIAPGSPRPATVTAAPWLPTYNAALTLADFHDPAARRRLQFEWVGGREWLVQRHPVGGDLQVQRVALHRPLQIHVERNRDVVEKNEVAVLRHRCMDLVAVVDHLPVRQQIIAAEGNAPYQVIDAVVPGRDYQQVVVVRTFVRIDGDMLRRRDWVGQQRVQNHLRPQFLQRVRCLRRYHVVPANDELVVRGDIHFQPRSLGGHVEDPPQQRDRTR